MEIGIGEISGNFNKKMKFVEGARIKILMLVGGRDFSRSLYKCRKKAVYPSLCERYSRDFSVIAESQFSLKRAVKSYVF